MTTLQRILVSTLSLLFLFCIPLHIFEVTTHTDHHTQSHSKDACPLTLIDELFSHFHEMTSVLFATLLIFTWGLIFFWHQNQYQNLHTVTQSWIPTILFETYLSSKKGTLYWLKLQTTSPPVLV